MKEDINVSNVNKEHWFQRIEKWEKSGKKQKLFCDEHHLSPSTFAYWRSRYLAEKKPKPAIRTLKVNQARAFGFIPVKQPEPMSAMSNFIQAKFPSGVMLSLPPSMPVSDIIHLIKGLSS